MSKNKESSKKVEERRRQRKEKYPMQYKTKGVTDTE